MEITSVLNDANDNGGRDVTIKPAASQGAVDDSAAQLDELAGFEMGQTSDNLPQRKFDVNNTIITNDKSAVGDYKTVMPPTPKIEDMQPTPVTTPEPAPQPESESTIDVSMASITDPAKMDFIKTYTKEYDDLVASTTHAVELLLDQIDKTVKEHTSDIVIPEEAIAFVDGEKPKDGKVQKFDDAQQIVRSIMDKASQAKKDSEAAAAEASQIYDGIQQFKRDTKEEIADIRNRDEFGHPIKPIHK